MTVRDIRQGMILKAVYDFERPWVRYTAYYATFIDVSNDYSIGAQPISHSAGLDPHYLAPRPVSVILKEASLVEIVEFRREE